MKTPKAPEDVSSQTSCDCTIFPLNMYIPTTYYVLLSNGYTYFFKIPGLGVVLGSLWHNSEIYSSFTFLC